MGIWIRSQDRLRLLNLNGYNLFFENDSLYQIIGFNTTNSNSDCYWILGRYSTKEKAIKVLDMIQVKIKEPIYQVNIAVGEIETHKDIVFQMPQDNEVVING